MSETTATRWTLRQLPLPAKLVVTLFLLTVGLGYSSAMVQMHFQHTNGDGQPMPGPMDVVEIFAGKSWITREQAEKSRPVSKLEKLVMGPIDGAAFSGSGSMAPAFFHKDPTESYHEAIGGLRSPDPAKKAKVDAEREGERASLHLWINLPDDKRKAAYDADSFTPSADQAPKALTAEFRDNGSQAIKVKSILDARCAVCHGGDGDASNYPLDSYDKLAKYMQVPPHVVVAAGADGAWCQSERQISKEKLAQSTHAHLLSFAMLFSLTGIIFAFTSYPGIVRGVLGPFVLLAQVADVSCWWLARLDGPGIYFAWAIMGTGGAVGLGLMAQIVLSTFNMYGPKGKLILAVVFAGAIAGGGLTYKEVVEPELQAEKARKDQLENETRQAAEDAANAGKKAATPVIEKKDEAPEGKAAPPSPPSKLERLMAGTFDPKKKGPFGGSSNGGMVRAFFDKDQIVFLRAMEDKDPILPTLIEERKGEQAAFLAWVKSTPEVRKKAYEEDAFPVPAELHGKPFTAEFMANDKVVKLKTLINSRCTVCHNPDGDAFDFPLTKYEEFEEYLNPESKE